MWFYAFVPVIVAALGATWTTLWPPGEIAGHDVPAPSGRSFSGSVTFSPSVRPTVATNWPDSW
jgi:hypothetical protein